MTPVRTPTRPPAEPPVARAARGRVVAVAGCPAAASPTPTPAPDLRRIAARAFGDLLLDHGDAGDEADLLRGAATVLARLVGADRASAFTWERDPAVLRGRAGAPASVDRMVRRLLLDDGIRRLAAARAPMSLGSGASLPGLDRVHAGAVLTVPVVRGDRPLALVVLEDRDRRRVFTTQDLEVCARFAALLAPTLEGVRAPARVVAPARRRPCVTPEGLADLEVRLAAAGGEPSAVLGVLADVSGREVGLLTPSGEVHGSTAVDVARLRAFAGRVARAGAGLAPGRTGVLAGDASAESSSRCIVATVAAGALAGHVLAILEDGHPLVAGDAAVALRGAAALAGSSEPGVGRSLADVDPAVREVVAARALGVAPAAAVVRASLEGLGVGRDAHRVVAFVPGGPVGGRIAPAGWWPAVEVEVEGGTAVIVGTPADLAPGAASEAVRAALVGALPDGDGAPVVAVSAPVRSMDGVPRALRQARRLARLRGERAGAGGLTVPGLGAARLLVCDPEDGRGTAEDILGPILVPQDPSAAQLLPTLVTYLESGGSTTDTAVALSLHVNSVRHRLKRLREALGFDVAGDADARLLARAALAALGPVARPAN